MQKINTNTAETFQFGREAARFWGLSVKHGESGDANAIVALVHAQRFLTFDATVERKKDDTAETFEFDIMSLSEPYWNNDGSKDTRKMAARTAALALRLFDINELTNAVKQRLARCIKVAVYLLRELSALSDEEIATAVRLEKGKLVVPYGLVAKEPAEDASAKEKAVHQAIKDDPIALDGKDGMSIAELSRRANPPKTTRAASDNKNNGASFVGSIDYIVAVLASQTSEETDESEVGLSTDIRRKLFALGQSIAAYFVVDPMDEEEIGEPQEPVAAAA